MFLKHPKEKDLKEISLDEFEIQLMELVRKHGQPDRLNPEDTKIYAGTIPDKLNWCDPTTSVCDSRIPENKQSQGEGNNKTLRQLVRNS